MSSNREKRYLERKISRNDLISIESKDEDTSGKAISLIEVIIFILFLKVSIYFRMGIVKVYSSYYRLN